MGRPIKKAYIGNALTSGQQITATAWVPGDTQARTDGYIVSQKGTGKYIMAANAATVSGLVSLTNGALTAPGQANIVVSPWGSHGSGATVSSLVGIGAVSINTAGGGTVSQSYQPGDVLSLVGGTDSPIGNVSVASVKPGLATVTSSGTGFNSVNSYVLFNGAGWTTTGNAKVTGVDANGNILTLGSLTGVFTGNPLLPNPVVATNFVNGGTGPVAANIRWDLNAVTVASVGSYSVIPSNPVGLTASASGGTAANVNVTWQVTSLNITNAGVTSYDAAKITFNSGSAAATATVKGGNITATTVTAGGSYATIPTATVGTISNPEYAMVINDQTVRTFAENQYHWQFTLPLSGPGTATIQNS